MPTLQSVAEDIVKELMRIQTLTVSAITKDDDFPFPRMIATGDGGSLVVSKKLDHLIGSFATQLRESQTQLLNTHTDAEWNDAVRRAFGPALASIDLDLAAGVNAQKVLADVKATMAKQTPAASQREHSFGCTLFGNSDEAAFDIGPVRFEPRIEWLDRKLAEKSISTTMHRRIKQGWNGKKPAKRKRSVESMREQDILDAIAGCPYVCSVKVTGFAAEAGKEKALTAARLALAAIALVWQTPSKALEGFNLIFDRTLRRQKILTFAPGSIILSGSKLSHLPHGPSLKKGEWEKEFSARRAQFGVVGEVLDFLLSPDGSVARPKLMNVLAQALLWFHEACRESVTLMAVVNFAASMDTLGGGHKETGIFKVMKARIGITDQSKISPGGPKVKTILEKIYGQGRSRTIHGTNDRLGHDWSGTRGHAEQFARYCLLACIDWAASNPTSDDPSLLTR